MTRTLTDGLKNKTLAVTLATALAVTATTATPARAETDAAGAIAAASFFALAATVIIASSRNDTRRAPHPGHPDPRKLLPADCRFDVGHGRDRGTYYGRRCLVTQFDHWSGLPNRCKERLDLPHRRHDLRVYDAQCLARAGYRPDDASWWTEH